MDISDCERLVERTDSLYKRLVCDDDEKISQYAFDINDEGICKRENMHLRLHVRTIALKLYEYTNNTAKRPGK